MNFKEYMCEREKVINEFLNQPIDVIVEMIDFEDVKVVDLGKSGFSTRYHFDVGEERYLVILAGHKGSYELSFSLDKKGEEFTGALSNLYHASKIYAGLLKIIKMFIEENDPDEITITVTMAENDSQQKKKFNNFQKMIKYVFKKYKETFKEYKIGNVKRKSMGDFALDTLTIERRSNK